MVAPIRVPLQGDDQLSPAFRLAAEASGDLATAIAKLAKQDEVNRVMDEAKVIYKQMTEGERLATQATVNYQEAQKKAAAEQEKATQATKENKSALQNMAGGLDQVVQGLTGFSIAQLSVVGAVVAAGNAAKEAVTNWMDYALSMDKLSMMTDMNVEDVSRLIQVADDYRVEQSTMEAAMKLAIQNGFVPTIENVAQLSDKYKSLSDPVERAAAMEQVFGRQWKDMIPLLEQGGDAIRQNAAAMDAGLIVTQAQVEQARAAAKALDDWNDSLTAFKNSFASGVLPALTDFVTLGNKSNQIANESGTTWMRYVPILNGLYNVGTSVAAMFEKKTDAESKNAAATNKSAAADERQAMAAEMVANKQAAAEKNAAVAQSYALRAQVARVEASKLEAGVMMKLSAGQVTYSRDLQTTNGLYRLSSSSLDKLNADYKTAADLQKDLASATRAADEAQKAFNDDYGSKASQSLSKYAGEGKKYREGLAIQDKVLGTNTAAQYDAQKSLDTLSQQFARGQITAQQYEQGLKDLQPTFEGFDANLKKTKQSLVEAQTSWDTFLSKLGAANGQTFTVRVQVEYTGEGGGGGGGGGGGSRGRRDAIRASGGPVYTGQQYYVGELGPEPFIPAMNGRILSVSEAKEALAQSAGRGGGGGGNTSISIGALNLPGVTNPNQFIAELGRLARNARNSGAANSGVF